MKSSDFEQMLLALADGYRQAGSLRAHDQLATLARIFGASPSATMTAISKRLAAITDLPTQGDDSLWEALKLLAPLTSLVNAIGGAKARSEVSAINNVLQRYSGVSLVDFVAAASSPMPAKRAKAPKKTPQTEVQSELITSYAQEFKSTLGDLQQFDEFFRRLQSDPLMGTAELSALAKAVTGAGARGRDASLKKIATRHLAFMAQKARLNATKGRSAA